MKRTATTGLALMLATATPALAARSHLVPEDSYYASGEQPRPIMPGTDEMAPLFDRLYVIRLIGERSFLGTFGFGLREEKGRFTMRTITRSRLNNTGTDCEAPLDSALASDLKTAWRKVTFATRFAEEMPFGLDGAMYHFAARASLDHPFEFGSGDPFYGKVWSPDAGTPPQILIVIADGLGKYCATHDKSLLPPLAAQADALAQRPQSEF